MEVASRSYLLAGVALVGAGAIAVAPMQPTPADIAVPAVASVTTPVELNALVNPLQLWSEVIATTVDNVGALTDTVLADPAPIASNVVNNQLITAQVLASVVTTFGSGLIEGVGGLPDSLRAAFEQISNGDIEGGVSALATAFITPVVGAAFPVLFKLGDITAVLQNPFLNIANVIEGALPSALVGVGLPMLATVIAPVFQVGITGQGVYDGIQASDFEAVANALVSFPSDMVNTVLNGNPKVGSNGILGSPFGLVSGLLSVRQAIADALKPPAVSTSSLNSVAAAPELEAETLTVTLDKPAAVDTGPTENDGAAANLADGADDAGTVKDGAKAEPGKLGANAKKARADAAVKALGGNVQKSVKKLGDNVDKSVKKLRDNVKKALGGKDKKKATSDSGGGSSAGAE